MQNDKLREARLALHQAPSQPELNIFSSRKISSNAVDVNSASRA